MHKWRQQLLASLLRDKTNQELSSPYTIARLESFIFLSLVGICTLIVFGLVNLGSNNYFLGNIELVVAGIALLNLMAFLRWRRFEVATTVVFALLLPLLLYLTYTGGLGGTGVVWLFVFPPVVFYMAGVRIGLVWMLTLAIGLAALITLEMTGLISTPYSLIFLRQIVAALVAITLMIYLHERVSEKARLLMLQQNDKQERLNEQLEMSRRHIEEDRVRYRALLESIGDGIIATNAKGRILLANQAALRMLQLQLQDIIGKRYDVFPVEDEKGRRIPYSERILTKVLATNKTVSTNLVSQYYYVAADGHRFPVASTQTPVSVDGKVTGAVFLFRDVTEEQRIDQAKTELVSLASHQLNGPLTAVSWYTEMLTSGEGGTLTKEQRSYLQEIYNGTTKMVDLVSDFLNISRIELGTFVPKLQPTDVAALAAGIITEIKPTALRLNEEYQKLPILNIDKRLVQIIIQNLISNAVKYTPSNGNITLGISTKHNRARRRLCVTVSDTGLGIPIADQPRIFTKMYRADNAKLYESEGTGLGLYIVKSIVDKLGGSVKLQSEVGKGTIFTVELPVGSGKMLPEAAATHRPKPKK